MNEGGHGVRFSQQPFSQQPFIRSTSYLAGELPRTQGSVKCEAVWMSNSGESL
jgi:hypothetical protein